MADGYISQIKTLDNKTYLLRDSEKISTINASGTAPLTLSGSKSETTYTLTGSIADASASASGIVNTDAQTFSGVKTFDNGLHIYGTISTQGTGSAAGTMYPGGAYHSGHNSIILHGDTAGVSGIGFTSEKATKSGTTTNINGSSDRAFIQYHAYGVTPAAEGTAPTLDTSGELGTLVIGVGNDATDTIRLQAPGTAGILHQIGATAYPIPHTTNTNGSVGGTTTPIYVEAGVIKAGTTLGTASQKAESYFVKAVASTDNAIVRFDGTGGQVQKSGIIIDDSDNMTIGSNRILNQTAVPGQGEILLSVFGFKTGYPLYTDPTFVSGMNSIGVYNNSGGGTVTHTRGSYTSFEVPSPGTDSSSIIKIETTGTASPGCGGFVQSIPARANAQFIQIFRALVPADRKLYTASNGMGTGYRDEWLTSNNGTGKWEWYARRVICGQEGTLSVGGHIYIDGSVPVTWYLASCNVYDITKTEYDGLKTRYTDAANLTSTTNAVAYYTNTTGTFGSKASANGALYATSANGALQWGTLPLAQGGTGATTAANARTNLGLGTMALETAVNYLARSGGQMTGPLTWKDSTALPETTSGQYFLVIDAFANGGTTKWISKANALTSLGAAPAVTGGYLPLSGGTLTGAFTTANGTWNTMGDDAYFGDINKAGHIGIKGKNGNTGLFFTTYNQSSNTTGGAITWDGTKFNITSDTAIAGTITNATSATSAGKWTTARNISISDSDGTNTGTAVSVDGSAAVTLKLPATIKATVIGDGSQLTSLKTQNLVRPAGLNGVNDVTYQALINDVRANRLAFLPADQIIIEKTTDGGITWEDAGISDGTKTALFSETRPGVSIPKINNEINTSCGLRITITAMKYDVPAGTPETQKYNYWNSSYVKSTERYNQIKLMYFWVSTATNALKVTVQKATGANPNSWINVFSNNNYGMTGWSGNDIITFGQGVFGGGTTQTGNTWNWRITLMTCGPNGSDTLTQSNLTSTMMVSEIRGYGDTYWTAGNKYAASDHLYSWDSNKNATFPSNITASKFIGALQGNADTATKFNSTRKIELTGAVTGSATTDGSSGWTISTTVNHNHDDRYSIASGVITLGSNTITPVTSVNGHSGSSVSVTASDLGLASALKYVGTKSSLPTATDSTTYSTYNNGDVITVSAKEYAYVKGSNAAGSSWVELGDEGSYKLRQTAFANSTGTADGTNTSTSFIYSFSQNENGAISDIKTRQLPTLTNVSYTAATDNNEYPILLKNSTGSDTTAAGVRFASGTNQQVTINPSTGTVSTRRLVINNSSSNGTVPDLVFSRTSWSYINIPDNDAAVLAIGRGTGDNASQKLIIQGDGVVRPGSDNTQVLGKSTRRWKEVHGVNFYGTFNGTATYSQGLAKWAIPNSNLNDFVSNGALRYSWEGGNNGIDSKPTDVNAFGVIAMKTATNWTGQLLMSTDSEPGLYWRTNLTTDTPTYGSWTPLASGNGGVYYGTCATAADVAAKVVVCKHYHTLKAGDIIVVTFTNSNTQAQPTLNVNNTGAVSVKMAYSGGIVDLGSTTQLSYTCTFIYDGTYWLIINQQNTIQLATASNQTNWRSILLSNSNSGDENFTPSANTLGRTYAAHNVKYQPSTGTLRAPIMKTPKVQIEFNHVNKAHIEWNDTDSSIDFIFD